MLSVAATNALAVGVLGAMGLALAAYAAFLLWRCPLTTLQSLLYGLNVVLARVHWRARVSGPLPLEPGEGAVIVCNHRCPIDPSFIYLITNRVVHWMVAKEYCLHPAIAWFFRTVECIPVSRGGIDTGSTKAAIRFAQEGGLVGLFPEGRINATDEVLLPGRPGAAMIALRARVRVVPCYVSGSPYDGTIWGSFLMPAMVRLEVGRPIDVSEFFGRERERDVLEHVTRLFLTEIARLAGKSDYRPKLAGRFYKPQRAEP
jgi:1-acyl-sn-glycerol-3-phosphate acyltransferase